MHLILICLTVVSFVCGLLGDKEARIIGLACIGVFLSGSVVALVDFWQGYPPLGNLPSLPMYFLPLMMVATSSALRKIRIRVFHAAPTVRPTLTKA